ncbi:hypothetical protein BDR03DRAFT_953797 [Suillus americanus]|nr:hypothetical protein BDR03DRAFT_953797 [Suillus americanus]
MVCKVLDQLSSYLAGVACYDQLQLMHISNELNSCGYHFLGSARMALSLVSLSQAATCILHGRVVILSIQ